MIQIEGLSMRAGTFSLSDISFSVSTGQYAVLMGKTGCGKTCLLETICGLRRCLSGEIVLMERCVTHTKAAERAIGYVPQDGALFPTMTVYDNLAFPLAIRKWPRKAMDERVRELGELLGIRALLQRKPGGLSRGEAQRVALGRALAYRPPVLCMDEPLSALDEDTRIEMTDLLREVKTECHVTVLHVTHNSNDAARLADRLLRLEKGAVLEVT